MDKGTYFTANFSDGQLTGPGCKHVCVAPGHPQSNGFAENFIGRAVHSTSPEAFLELHRASDSFL